MAVSLTLCGPAWNEAAQADRLSSVVVDAPVRLSPIRVDGAADPAVVVLAIQNVGQEVVTSVQVTAFVFAGNGHARGFTTFRTETTIALGATREVAPVLRVKPQADDTVVLVPREVRGSAGEVLWFRTSHEALDDALSLVRGVPLARAASVRPPNEVIPVRLALVTLARPGGNARRSFCNEERAACKAICGSSKCGVHQFECNRKECSSNGVCAPPC